MVATMQPVQGPVINPWALLVAQALGGGQQQQPQQAAPAPAQGQQPAMRMPGPISGTPQAAPAQPNAAQQAADYYNNPTLGAVMNVANMLSTLGQITSQPGSTGAIVGQQGQERYGDFLYNRALANALALYNPGGGGGGGNVADFTSARQPQV